MTTIRCHCGGRSDCRLCNGTGGYGYQPGPRGWMPFRCPTCEGSGWAGGDDADDHADGRCPTCRGAGIVDPADPPTRRTLDVIWKALFGA